ncbi:Phosphoglycolate phosphatase [Saliniradius amylolyticus]|uniref:Phosphoglycolate phosphatase n=1 Tax=Saliniradius amylolyticus TaxID=2183582 RepID=A0A2S2E326_9ALTE|nr:Phosphoglycolate phosphatase [Saliniradius amylolyticus]
MFDLDGTLLDTADDMGTALNQLLKAYQRPPAKAEDYRLIASHGAKGMLTLGFGEHLPDLGQASLRQQFLDLYATAICRHTRLYDGIEAVISTLTQQGIPWGIVTNKPQTLTEKLLKHFPVLSAADIILCGDSLPRRKPDPLPLTYAAEKLEVVSRHCWYIGDARRDIDAALGAGMIAILAEYGYIHPNENPQQWPADYRITHPEALLAWLVP